MKTNKIYLIATALALLFAACSRQSDNGSSGASSDTTSTSAGQGGATTSPSHENGASAVQPDNTGRNVRDRSDASVTPGDQGGSDADREMTRRIRRAIVANDQLSANAKNIKVITVDGKVILRGPVDSEQEKQTIARLVQQAGVQTVENQLEVKATNQ